MNQVIEAVHGLDPSLMETGARGTHVLFSQRAIRRAFARVEADLVREGHLLAAHQALRALSALPDVTSMVAYVGALPEATTDMLVFLYFRSLDRFLADQPHAVH